MSFYPERHGCHGAHDMPQSLVACLVRHTIFLLCVAASTLTGAAWGRPLPQVAPMTIPFWKSSFTYAGTTYPFKMVGTNPAAAGITTTIPNEIIPIQLTFSDGTVLDATPLIGILPGSPVYANASYPEGVTQYGDAIMRSEFWRYVANTNYHVLLAQPAIEPTVQIQVPVADGYTQTNADGSKAGYVAFAWFIHSIEPQVLTQLAIDPRTLAMFVTAGTKVLKQSGSCCYGGYHEAFSTSTPSGTAIFTTVWASVTADSLGAMPHEIAEWLNDPFYMNNVPRWVVPGGTKCGGHQLEVVDPVTTHDFTVNGYAVDDAAFYSWFSRDVPSIGINGQYDLTGVLNGPARVCS